MTASSTRGALALALFTLLHSPISTQAGAGEPLAAEAARHQALQIARSESAQRLARQLPELRLQARTADLRARERALARLGDATQSYVALAKPARNDAQALRREALNAYTSAAAIALQGGAIRYAREISTLSSELADPAPLDGIFRRFLATTGDESGLYVARIALAEALAKRSDPAAETHLRDAIAMRLPIDAVEAHVVLAELLIARGRPQAALDVLSRFDLAGRQRFPNIAFMRQDLVHELGLDTREVDAEVQVIEAMFKGMIGVRLAPRAGLAPEAAPATQLESAPAAPISSTLDSTIGDEALDDTYMHLVPDDDSRGPNANTFIPGPGGRFTYAPWLINIAEVIFKEAGGESTDAQIAIAWGIRNRSRLNMNNCDAYPGAEAGAFTASCREATPIGPEPEGLGIVPNYSCVVHGGTSQVGGTHKQMNDGHVDLATLERTGVNFVAMDVTNDVQCDITTRALAIGSFCPVTNTYTEGNPAGAQEWRDNNYCAARPECKLRLANVGGTFVDTGDPCPARTSGQQGDNFFWGRKPTF